MKFQEFADYSGPTGLYVATGAQVVPLECAEGIAAVAQSAMLTSLGPSVEAKQYAAAMQQSLATAHALDHASV